MKKIIYFLLTAMLIYSCDNNLSRSNAEKLINENAEFQETGNNPKLNENAINDGINQGYWTQGRDLTSKGYENFSDLNYNNLSLHSPLKCTVTSIDGIADSKNVF